MKNGERAWKVTITEPWCSGGLSRTFVYLVTGARAIDQAYEEYRQWNPLAMDRRSVTVSAVPAEPVTLLFSHTTQRSKKP